MLGVLGGSVPSSRVVRVGSPFNRVLERARGARPPLLRPHAWGEGWETRGYPSKRAVAQQTSLALSVMSGEAGRDGSGHLPLCPCRAEPRWAPHPLPPPSSSGRQSSAPMDHRGCQSLWAAPPVSLARFLPGSSPQARTGEDAWPCAGLFSWDPPSWGSLHSALPPALPAQAPAGAQGPWGADCRDSHPHSRFPEAAQAGAPGAPASACKAASRAARGNSPRLPKSIQAQQTQRRIDFLPQRKPGPGVPPSPPPSCAPRSALGGVSLGCVGIGRDSAAVRSPISTRAVGASRAPLTYVSSECHLCGYSARPR